MGILHILVCILLVTCVLILILSARALTRLVQGECDLLEIAELAQRCQEEIVEAKKGHDEMLLALAFQTPEEDPAQKE